MTTDLYRGVVSERIYRQENIQEINFFLWSLKMVTELINFSVDNIFYITFSGVGQLSPCNQLTT